MNATLLVRSIRTGLLLAVLALGGGLGVLAANVGPAPLRLTAGTFADAAFRLMWERTDLLIEQGAVSRTWLWGPTAGLAIREPWTDSPGGVRLVQYFDKGRMEISNPNAPATDPFYVTNGLLAIEMISGQIQTGPSSYTASTPANINIAGDRDDTDAPTYASFRAVSNMPGGDHRVNDATGQPVNQAIARNGTVSPARQDYGVRAAYYEPLTGHNVPDVFWTFLNGPGTVIEGGQVVPRRLFDPWFSLTGLPISEAYWSVVKIGPARVDVLIQAFERRVLTYAPNNPEGFKVEMGNIGMHYVEWRYGAPGSGGGATPAPPPVALPDIRIQGIANQKGGLDLNSQSVTLLNATSGPVDMTGWRLVAPKNSYDDVYVFPHYSLAAGGQLTIYAGWGADSANQLFMHRVTWLFDATPFDGVVLYDGAGREVVRYFLTGGVAPTAPPAPGQTPPPTATAPTGATPGVTDTPATKPTATLPGPEASGTPSPVATATAAGTATTTATPGGAVTDTPTPTPSVFPTGTPTPHAYTNGVAIAAWVNNSFPHVGTPVTLIVRLTANNTPVPNATMAAIWYFPNDDQEPCIFSSGSTGIGTCVMVMPTEAAGQTVWIDAGARIPGDPTVYLTNTGVRPQP